MDVQHRAEGDVETMTVEEAADSWAGICDWHWVHVPMKWVCGGGLFNLVDGKFSTGSEMEA